MKEYSRVKHEEAELPKTKPPKKSILEEDYFVELIGLTL